MNLQVFALFTILAGGAIGAVAGRYASRRGFGVMIALTAVTALLGVVSYLIAGKGSSYDGGGWGIMALAIWLACIGALIGGGAVWLIRRQR